MKIIFVCVLNRCLPCLNCSKCTGLICEWFSFFMDMTEWLTEWFSNNPVFLVSITFSCFYVSITCTTTWTQQCSTSLYLFCCSLWNRQLKWKVAPTHDWLTNNFFCSKTSKFALLLTVDKLRMQSKTQYVSCLGYKPLCQSKGP